MTLKRKWKLHVIHHSHTDIGYTERQEKIEQYQVDYISQAAQISDDIFTGKRKQWKGFKWTCETFWAVEKFLQKATDEQIQQFEDGLKRGDIELSGTYLNMTELPDERLLKNNFLKAQKYGQSLGIQVDSAMTSDINGYSWGYAQALYDCGVQNLLSSIHTHHGMFPLGQKQTPFYWETPKGDRLLVWVGEHYMLGNELGLAPNELQSYTIQDDIKRDHWATAEARILNYLSQLEAEGYPYDFIPVCVHGRVTDNAPPRGEIVEGLNRLNEKFGDQIQFEMSTLNQFFKQVKDVSDSIPVYKGDWPDWWSDGVASTAMHTQIFKDSQRKLRILEGLDSDHGIITKEKLAEIEYQLTMYAEHTWGYHSSVYEPWHPFVQSLGVRKEAYAANASRLVYEALDELTKAKGEALMTADRKLAFKVINPYDSEVEDKAYIHLDRWESPLFENGLEVIDRLTGEIVPHQRETVSRGDQVEIISKLGPGKEKEFLIRPVASQTQPLRTTSSYQLKGSDGVYDLKDFKEIPEGEQPYLKVTEQSVETDFVRIQFGDGEGINSWVDKRSGVELLRGKRQYGAFTPIYEQTPTNNDSEMSSVRRNMGRNRKGMNVERTSGKFIGVKELTRGTLYTVLELQFKATGMSHYSLLLKVYLGSPRVDVSVRMHKDSVWQPENVYLSLPFTTGNESEQLWLDKPGAIVRPGVDQIPGTLTDYYCVQEGLALSSQSDQQGLVISTPDTPLIQLGSLQYGQRVLHGQQVKEEGIDQMYAWVLTNYWETNFKATIGGFYEFRYVVEWGKHLNVPEKALKHCGSLNTGLVSFRV